MKIKELHLYLNLNIPDTNEPVLFTGDMLTTVKKYKYPYFSADIDYSKLSNIDYLTYDEIVDLFFNKTTFLNVFQPLEKTENIETSEKTMYEKNILKMMTLLFPTKFPSYNNITTSTSSITPPVLNWAKGKYSYLKYNNKVYTIIRSVWLNDVINHTKYFELLKMIKNYYIAAQIEKNREYDIEIKRLKKELEKLNNNQKQELENQSKKTNNNNVTFDTFDWIIEKKLNDLENKIKIQQKTNTNQLNIIELTQDIETLINIVSKLKNSPDLKIFTEKMFNELVSIENITEKLLKPITDALKPLIQISKKIIALKIRQQFYKTGSIDINEDSVMNTTFAPYKNLIEQIKTFLPPNMESKNEKLQNLISNYANNEDKEYKMIRFVNTVFQRISDVELNKIIVENTYDGDILRQPIDNEEFKELLDTSVSVQNNNTECLIYVLMDVLEGEINDTNKSKYSCVLRSEGLGNMVEKMWNKANSYEISRYRISSDITVQKPTNENNTNNLPINPINLNNTINTNNEKIGGLRKRKTLRNHKKKRKTKRLFYNFSIY